jgi:hypothetical protein
MWFHIFLVLATDGAEWPASRFGSFTTGNSRVSTEQAAECMTSCGDTAAIWHWTRARVALLLRTDPRCVPHSWLIFPNFALCPRPKNHAVLWLLANMVRYTITSRKVTSFLDYTDFMRRARWKTYRWRKRTVTCGNYLDVCTQDWNAASV